MVWYIYFRKLAIYFGKSSVNARQAPVAASFSSDDLSTHLPNHQLEDSLCRLSATMAAVTNVLPDPLLDLLSNDLILRHTSPYIGIKSLVSLAATSKAYKSLVYDTPHVFQHVDLQDINILMGFNVRMFCMGSHKINELYAQRFRMIFTILENRNVIQDVRTLILDGIFVPITIIEDILCNQRYQIRLLSLRDVNRLPKDDVLGILRHLIRPTRPKAKPELRGLYLFGHPSGCQEVHHFEEVIQRPERWYHSLCGLDRFRCSTLPPQRRECSRPQTKTCDCPADWM